MIHASCEAIFSTQPTIGSVISLHFPIQSHSPQSKAIETGWHLQLSLGNDKLAPLQPTLLQGRPALPLPHAPAHNRQRRD